MADTVLVCDDVDGVRLLRFVQPPVNAFSLALRRALAGALQAADADPHVDAVVLAGAGKGFSAGGDLREFGTPAHEAPPTLALHLQPQIEQLGKPVIAALHGFAVGGGFELALACHYRVAEAGTRLALPEVDHGLIPPSGSQRLPRAIGAAAALALMLGPTSADAATLNRQAAEVGQAPLFDGCEATDAVQQALLLAARLRPLWRDDPQVWRRGLLRHRRVAGLDDAAWHGLGEQAHTPARQACVDAVRAACGSEFDAGLQVAWQHFVALRAHVGAPSGALVATPRAHRA